MQMINPLGTGDLDDKYLAISFAHDPHNSVIPVSKGLR